MESQIRYRVGVDASKDKLTVCLAQQQDHDPIQWSAIKEWPNTAEGMEQIHQWVCLQVNAMGSASYVMEATGNYHEQLAMWLDDHGQGVHVELPTRVKYYAKSLSIKSKTDAIDAALLARMGLERKLDPWRRPEVIYLKLRDLTRYREHLLREQTQIRNLQHSQQYGHRPHHFVQDSSQKIAAFLAEQIRQCEEQIKALLDEHPPLRHNIDLLCTIRGVGWISAVTVVAETTGFAMMHNQRQLASYAGYDVVQRQSGTSVNGRTRISKRGNSHVRRVLHFPSISAKQHDEHFAQVYQRIVDRRVYPKIALVAIQRKLLILMYTLWKKQQPYDPDYHKKVASHNGEATQDRREASSFC